MMTEEDDDIQNYIKPWVGLTDKEIELAYGVIIKIRKKDTMPVEQKQFARTLELLLKKRNT